MREEQTQYVLDFARKMMSRQGYVVFSRIGVEFEAMYGQRVDSRTIKKICEEAGLEIEVRHGGRREGEKRRSFHKVGVVRGRSR